MGICFCLGKGQGQRMRRGGGAGDSDSHLSKAGRRKWHLLSHPVLVQAPGQKPEGNSDS